MSKEVDLEIMNEVNEELCLKCKSRFWEECGGISSFLNNITGCDKAKKLYFKKEEDKQ